MARYTLRHSLWTELAGHGDLLVDVWAAAEPDLRRWDSLGALVDDLDALPEVDAITALARLSQAGDRRAGMVVMILLAGPRAWRIVGRTNARFRFNAITEDEVVCEAWELLHRLNPRVWVMETYMWEISRRIATRLSRETASLRDTSGPVDVGLDGYSRDELPSISGRNASEELMEVFAAVRGELSTRDSELIAAWFTGSIETIANRDQVSPATMQRRKDRAMRRLVDAARVAVAAQR